MAMWKKTCEEFNVVRKKIYDEDPLGIMKELYKICDNYGKLHDDWADSFRDLADEIKDDIDAECEDDGTADYYLSQFYDICDAAKIWLPF